MSEANPDLPLCTWRTDSDVPGMIVCGCPALNVKPTIVPAKTCHGCPQRDEARGAIHGTPANPGEKHGHGRTSWNVAESAVKAGGHAAGKLTEVFNPALWVRVGGLVGLLCLVGSILIWQLRADQVALVTLTFQTLSTQAAEDRKMNRAIDDRRWKSVDDLSKSVSDATIEGRSAIKLLAEEHIEAVRELRSMNTTLKKAVDKLDKTADRLTPMKQQEEEQP